MKQFDLFYDEGYIGLDEVSKTLSISKATARNWLKSGRLNPIYSQGHEVFFLKEDIELLLENIEMGKERSLKSRRNKLHIKGSYTPRTYIQSKDAIKVVDAIIRQISLIGLPEHYERVILAEYALKLLVSREMVKCEDKNVQGIIIEDFICNNAFVGAYSSLIDDILSEVTEVETKISQLKDVLCHRVDFIDDQDFLGLLYMSLQCIRERKVKGVYYTPFAVVKDAVDHLHRIKPINNRTKLVDPCCGTGNFIMYTYKYALNLENLHGYDISPLSIFLTRINMALISKTVDIDLLYRNFRCQDALLNIEDSKFDIVLGNPPWGFKYDREQEKKLRSAYFSARAKTVESFCVFTEYALKTVGSNGMISLILPQSLLQVQIHQPVREYMLLNCNIKRIRYWENMFDDVVCPAMTLTFQKKLQSFSTKGLEVVSDRREFLIGEDRNLERKKWQFDLTDEELSHICRIETSVEVAYLKQNADFALGIVTGDNSKYVMKNELDGCETILKGTDIFKYRYMPSGHYIKFEPANFQQVAPVDIYRANEKLIYRFICDRLVFAYDNAQTLSLNSANIVIPRVNGLKMKYILAVLNSRIIQYYYKHKFKSVKVLRSHIEDLPIPVVSAYVQYQIIAKVDKLLASKNSLEVQVLYEQIDMDIKEIFCLTESEYSAIKQETSNYNIFLLGK